VHGRERLVSVVRGGRLDRQTAQRTTRSLVRQLVSVVHFRVQAVQVIHTSELESYECTLRLKTNFVRHRLKVIKDFGSGDRTPVFMAFPLDQSVIRSKTRQQEI